MSALGKHRLRPVSNFKSLWAIHNDLFCLCLQHLYWIVHLFFSVSTYFHFHPSSNAYIVCAIFVQSSVLCKSNLTWNNWGSVVISVSHSIVGLFSSVLMLCFHPISPLFLGTFTPQMTFHIQYCLSVLAPFAAHELTPTSYLSNETTRLWIASNLFLSFNYNAVNSVFHFHHIFFIESLGIR